MQLLPRLPLRPSAEGCCQRSSTDAPERSERALAEPRAPTTISNPLSMQDEQITSRPHTSQETLQ